MCVCVCVGGAPSISTVSASSSPPPTRPSAAETNHFPQPKGAWVGGVGPPYQADFHPHVSENASAGCSSYTRPIGGAEKTRRDYLVDTAFEPSKIIFLLEGNDTDVVGVTAVTTTHSDSHTQVNKGNRIADLRRC